MTKFRLIDLKYFIHLWCKFFLFNVHVALKKLLIKITEKFSLTVILINIQRFNFASRHWINVLQIASFRQWTRICFFLIDYEFMISFLILFFQTMKQFWRSILLWRKVKSNDGGRTATAARSCSTSKSILWQPDRRKRRPRTFESLSGSFLISYTDKICLG